MDIQLQFQQFNNDADLKIAKNIDKTIKVYFKFNSAN
jgi:hypothetical protein